MVRLVNIVHRFCVVAISVHHSARHFLCLHRGHGLTYKANWLCCCTEFVEGGFYEDSGKWRQDSSLCETTAPNSVKNGLVVACLVFALAVTIEWISCLLLMRCALVPSSDRKYPNCYA